MRYLLLIIFMFFLTGCWENVRQSIGISTNPFSTKMEEKTKFNEAWVKGRSPKNKGLWDRFMDWFFKGFYK